ncbi:MAG TPA: capsule assembly Wzi family protein, partial [Gammaproteobacteria bacterium]|nr:capsule assembly Wzi family protein [Gammaproteobacteria bacterium]
DRLILSAGFVANEDDTFPTGSLLSFGFEYFQIDAGFREHWFSPLTDSSMLIGTQAQTMPSLTVSNYTPLTKLNLRYELFVAEMSHSERIRYGDGFTSGNPNLVGMHFSMQPLPGFAIGINRIMQFGGGERGGKTLRDVFKAFFDPSGTDNSGIGDDPEAEFGNQAASITASFIMPTTLPFSVYLEYAGEDTSTSKNTRLGNVAFSAGLHFAQLPGNLELTLEFSEWQNAWYVHHIYQDGLVNEGSVIGHWGAAYRVPGDGVGAFSTMARLGWQPRFGGWLEATYRSLDNETYSAPQYERADILDLTYSRRWRDFNVGIDLSAGNDSFGESFSRLGTFIRF